MKVLFPLLALVFLLSVCTGAIIVVTWDNPPSEWSSNYVTLIETSTNLTDWHVATVRPYITNGCATLTNHAPIGFYRVANAVKE